MKILIMSMLRLGDILLATPVIDGLRRRYPRAEIHLLINAQFAGLAPMLKHVTKVHLFDRRGYQEAIGSYDIPILEPLDRLDHFVSGLSAEKFDRVINLTQNKISGYLLGMIESPDKVGLCLESPGRASFGSSWFRYLEDHVASGQGEIFHFSDVFVYGSDITDLRRGLRVWETQRGQAEADEILGQQKDFVLVQALSSDVKKNWEQKKLVECLGQFQLSYPNCEVFLMGAEFEKTQLESLNQGLREAGVKSSLAICSFEGAFSLLKRAKLLLTMDTATKHLASATQVPVVELCLGSSDPRKTGVYQSQAIVVQSKVACTPCPHSSGCSQESFKCSESLPAGLVAMLMCEAYLKRFWQIDTIAREYAAEANVYITHFCESGFWFLAPQGEVDRSWMIDRILEKTTWKLFLDQQHKEAQFGFAEVGRRVRNSCEEVLPQIKKSDWDLALSGIEGDSTVVEKRVFRLLLSLKRILLGLGSDPEYQDFVGEVESLSVDLEESPNMVSFLAEGAGSFRTDGVFNLARARKLQNYLEDSKSRIQIKLNLLRSVRSQLTEKI